MNITFDKSSLESVVNDSLCSVSDKNTIPIIEGIRFCTQENGGCSITTYDLEKGFRAEIACDIAEAGNYVINAQKLNRIIKSMPDREVTITVDDRDIATVISGKSRFELHALDGNGFPSLPELDGERGFTINGGVLKKIIGQTSFAIAAVDQRPMLCGAFFKIAGDNMRIVACDGNRLAVRDKECDIKSTAEEDGADSLALEFIVPGKTLIQLVRLIDDGDEVKILLARKHVIFKTETKTFFSRLIDSDYIEYERVIPQSTAISVITDRMALLSALERASLVTEEKVLGQGKSYVRCEFDENILKISSSSVTGSVYDEIHTQKTGGNLIIGFNCRYLIDALRAADGERIEILMTNPLMSIVIKPCETEARGDDDANGADDGINVPEGENYLYMVCPVKMKE